jgi:transposase
MSRASREEWAKRVERWKDSGLSAKEYAAEIGVKATTLSYWSWKLGSDGGRGGDRSGERPAAGARRRRGGAAAGAAARFVELSASTSVAAQPVLELVFRGGIRVRVGSGFDEPTLTRLVRAVEAAQ